MTMVVKITSCKSKIGRLTHTHISTLVQEVFFCPEETRQEAAREKPLVAGDANLTIIML